MLHMKTPTLVKVNVKFKEECWMECAMRVTLEHAEHIRDNNLEGQALIDYLRKNHHEWNIIDREYGNEDYETTRISRDIQEAIDDFKQEVA